MMTHTEELQKWLQKGKEDWLKSNREVESLEICHAEPWGQLLNQAKTILSFGENFVKIFSDDDYFKGMSLEALKKIHDDFFAYLAPEAYASSFANPDFAVSKFDLKTGQLACSIYSSFFNVIGHARSGNYARMASGNSLLLKLAKLFSNNQLDYETALTTYKSFVEEDFELNTLFTTWCTYSSEFNIYRRIIEITDFKDCRHLYRYGTHVDKHAVKMAEFVASYPENQLRAIAKNHVQAFIESFKHKGIDYKSKGYAQIHYPFGLEKLTGFITEELEKCGLQAKVAFPSAKQLNEQHGYDMRFRQAIYFDQAHADRRVAASEKAMHAFSQEMKMRAGAIVALLFGETPFVPVIKETTIQMTEEQDKIHHQMMNKVHSVMFEIAPRNETTFSIISFPSTEIGEKFDDIFRDTLELNNLDGKHYEAMQEKMIEILDRADYVEVKGAKGNETDIRVQFPKINNPDKETNFTNCGADVNIPVGEVFTAPRLTGTDGVLHVADIYLYGLRYYNLKVTFKDGMVTDYSCTNYSDPDENRKYMFDNLLKPNKTLPLGEFAIGTNTLAYRMAQKYQIQHLLPILIIEKMGPHFAIGDTCYAHEEDSEHISVVSKKLITATGNEKSELRKTSPMEAYTNKHIDITLPYDMLAEITAVNADGSRVPIILDGLFVVPGTEELNIPLQKR